MSQEDLAHAAAVSPGTVRKVEQGGTVRMETLHALARALRVATGALMASDAPDTTTLWETPRGLTHLFDRVLDAVSGRSPPSWGLTETLKAQVRGMLRKLPRTLRSPSRNAQHIAAAQKPTQAGDEIVRDRPLRDARRA